MTVVARCQILRLKCTKFDFGWGSAPDPAGGAYSASPDPLAGFKGPTSKGREGMEGRGKGGLAPAMNLPWVEWPTTVIKYARNTLWTDS